MWIEQASKIEIVPFIKIVDLYKLKVKYMNEHNKVYTVIEELEKEGTSQIILKNWSIVSEEEMWQVYRIIKGFCIKCSLLLEYGNPTSLDKFVCNIYKVYQDSFFEKEYSMKQYFYRRGVAIWRLVDLRSVDNSCLKDIINVNKEIFRDNTYEKIIIRISTNTNREDILRILKCVGINGFNQQRFIIFPAMVEVGKYILDIAELSI